MRKTSGKKNLNSLLNDDNTQIFVKLGKVEFSSPIFPKPFYLNWKRSIDRNIALLMSGRDSGFQRIHDKLYVLTYIY